MPHRRFVRTVTISAIALVASIAQAQPPRHRTPVLDLTLGRHSVNGGLIDYRDGAFADLLVAGDVRRAEGWSILLAGGGAGVVGGFGDRCLIRPGGGCAPQANFVAFDVLAGVDVDLAGFSARTLIGPALYNGADATSLGAQARLDLTSPTLAHLGLGVMLRATVLPSHGGQRFVAWAAGGSLVVR